MDQPCLKHSGPLPADCDSSSPRPVCTFCLSSMKKPVSYQSICCHYQNRINFWVLQQKSQLDTYSYRESSQQMAISEPPRFFQEMEGDLLMTSAASCDPFETNMNLLFY